MEQKQKITPNEIFAEQISLEYSRIQEHLHNIEANVTGQLRTLQKNMQELVDYQQRCFSAIALRYQETVCEVESIKRNTFFGGIKYCTSVILMHLHNGLELLSSSTSDAKQEIKIIGEIKSDGKKRNVNAEAN